MIINVFASINNVEINGAKFETASVNRPFIKYIFK